MSDGSSRQRPPVLLDPVMWPCRTACATHRDDLTTKPLGSGYVLPLFEKQNSSFIKEKGRAECWRCLSDLIESRSFTASLKTGR